MGRRSKVAVLASVAVAAMTGQVATAIYASSRSVAARNDQAGMSFADDLAFASRALVAGERLVWMARSYALTHEPDLLARARAAEANLQGILRGVGRRANALPEGPLFASVLVGADRYGQAIQQFLRDTTADATPQEVALAFRKRVIPLHDRLETDLEEFMARRREQIAELHMATRDLGARIVPVMIGTCGLGLLASIMLARMAIRGIAGGVGYVSEGRQLRPDGGRPASSTNTAERSATVVDLRSIEFVGSLAPVLRLCPPTDAGVRRR